jgi:hypothetical protein
MKRLVSKIIAACSLVVVLAFISWLTSIAPVRAAADSWFRRLLGTPQQAAPARSGAREPLNKRPAHAESSFFNHLLALAPAITATLVDSFPTGFDVDGDGKADPGDKIRYTATITNGAAGTDALNLHFSDQPDANTTFVNGSVVIGPLALDETYQSVGNMTLSSANINATCGGNSLRSVTCNDVPSGATLTGFGATQGNANGTVVNGANTVTTSNGGTVLLNADGTFVYNPAAGFEGADEFWYTLSNSAVTPALTNNAKVTINVGGANGMVWFISSAGVGTGRQANPISLDAFSAINNGTGNNPASGDAIFVLEGSHSLTATLTLLNSQKFIGQDATVSVPTLGGPTAQAGNAYPAANPTGTAVSITSSAAAITLGSGNNLAGFTVGNSTTAITGTAVGTFNVREVTINTNGSGLVITTSGTAGSDATFTGFTSVTTTGGTNGIALTGVGGTLNLGSGALSGASGAEFLVSGGSATINYSGTINNTAGRSIDIQSRSGNPIGTITFSGAITDNGQGIFLDNNDLGGGVGTISFTGGLNLSTGTSPAFTATNGGIVNATQNNTSIVNTIATTTGTALNVANTTIGSSNLTFRSISAGTASGSAGTGIILDTTGSSGGLIVTGNSSGFCGGAVSGSPPAQTTAPQSADCTGGTIQHKTGADNTSAGVGVYLNNTANVSLTRMQFNDFDNFAIRGTNVTGFTLSNTNINGVNGNNDGQDEAAIRFTNLLGTASISNSTVEGAVETNIRVINDTGPALNALQITSSTIRNNSTITGGDGIFARAQSGATMVVKVTGCVLYGHRDDHIQTDAENSGNLTTVITGNTLTSNGTIGAPPQASTLGGQITISGGAAFSSSTSTFNVSNNTITGAKPAPITIGVTSTTSTASGLLSGTINNNILGQAGSANSGSSSSDGISVIVNGAATINAAITNNQIRQFNNIGIQLIKRDGSGNLNATVTGNTIAEPVAPNALQGILVTSGATSGPPADSGTVCVDIGGAGALANTITGPNFGGDLIRVRQRFSTLVRLPGFVDGPDPDITVDVANYLIGRNTITNEAPNAKASATTQAPGSFQTPGGGACTSGAMPTIAAPIDTDERLQLQQPGRGQAPGVRESISVVERLRQWLNPVLPVLAALSTPSRYFNPLRLFERSAAAAGKPATGVLNHIFAAVEVDLPNLPANKSIQVVFDVTVNSRRASYTTQGTVSATGISNVLTDDPDVNMSPPDPTVTPGDCMPNITVTSNADNGAGSLREALAQVCDGGSISFDLAGPGPHTITLNTGQLVIDRSLTVTGPTNESVTISGNNVSRVLTVNSGTTAALSNLTITQGNGSGSGGGAIQNGGSLTITGCTLAGNNTANDGGAIRNDGSLLIRNSTLSGNQATSAASDGGAILNASGKDVTLLNVTIAENSAGRNGGGVNNAGTLNIKNSIIALNTAPASGPNIFTTGGATTNDQGNNILSGDPKLGPLSSNGGPTQTYALLAGSAALDAGDNTAANTAGLTTDQRGTGFPRILDAADAGTTQTVDIGAYEARASVEDLANKSTPEDTPFNFNFNVGDAAQITNVTASSNNTMLVPNLAANLNLTGSGSTRNLAIAPVANESGMATITVAVFAGSESISDTFSLTVTEVNDPPDAVNDTLSAINEDAGQRAIPFADLLGNDTKGATNESGQTLTITNVGNAVGGAVSLDTPNAQVLFTPLANFAGTASFDYTVQDNGTTGGAPDPKTDTATASFTINVVNDAPAGTDKTVMVNEDATYTFTAADFGFTDPNDNPAHSFLAVKITTLPILGSLTNNNMAVTPGQSVSVTDINNGLLKFAPAANGNGNSYASFTFQVQDNGGVINGGVDLDPSPNTLTINVTSVNDAPVVATSAGTTAFVEGSNVLSTPVAIDPALTVSDIDNTTLTSATVSITTNFQAAEDVLAFANNSMTNFGNIQVDSYSGGILSLSSPGGTATVTQWQNALRAVSYTNSSNTPNSTTRTLSFQVNDGSAANNLSASVMKNISVTATNDSPINTVPLAQSVNEDTDLVFSAGNSNLISVCDVDAGSGDLTVTLTVSQGTLTLATTMGLTSSAGNGTASVSLTGTLTNLNNALNGLKYRGNTNYFGGDTLQIGTNDNGHTGAGGMLGDTDTVSIMVNAVADAPSVPSPIITNEDTQTAAIAISRNAADNAEVTHFKLTNITNGTLFKSNGTTPVNNNDFITVVEGNAGLKFTPAANLYSPITSFSFTVQASVNSTDAGLGGNTTTATITVNPVADTPSVTNATTKLNTQTSSGLVISRNAVDNSEVTHFKITAITNGTLFKSNGTTPVNNNDFITVAEGNVGLKFTPTTNFNGLGNFMVQAALSDSNASLGGGQAAALIMVYAPPIISKAFAPTAIAINGMSTLTFTITNPAGNPGVLNGLSVTDLFPNDVVVANPLTITNTCNGMLQDGAGGALAAGDNSIRLVGGTSAVAGSTCSFSVKVTAPTAGQKMNLSGNISSTEGGMGNTASATLSVAAVPIFTKAFAPTQVKLNELSTLTFTITNLNAFALTGVAFSDTLPNDVVLDANPMLSHNCGGTATATGGTNVISLTGGTVGANNSCTLSVKVKAPTAGNKNNTSGAISTTESGTGSTASATLTVIAPPQISKAFSPNSILIGGTSTLTFNLSNPAANTVSLTGVNFTDNLPTGVQVASSPNLMNTCGGTPTATAGTGVVSLTGVTLGTNGGSACQLSVNVTATSAGGKNNSVTIHSTNGGTGNTANATLNVNCPTITVNPATLPNGGVGLAYTSTTFTATGGSGSYAFSKSSDTLPNGLNLSGATLAGTPTEGGTFNFTITATDSTTSCTGSRSYTLVINRPPVLAPIGNKSVPPGQTLSFTAMATDPDPSDSLTYSLIGAPAGAMINSLTGQFAWTPTAAQIGVHTFTVKVTDNGDPLLSDSETITINVSNLPPTLTLSVSYLNTNPANVGLSAQLKDSFTNAPIPGKQISFSIGTQTVTGTTDGNGVAQGQIQVAAPGTYAAKASFAGDANYPMALTVTSFNVTLGGQSCSFALAPTSQSFAANGSTGTVALTTPASNCNWSAASTVPWITLTGGLSGTSNGTVGYTVASNPNSAPRSGTINLAGLIFTVVQGQQFNDVPLTHHFYEFIGKLSARGVTQGCGGGNFCPAANVTREQMAAFIIRSLGDFNPPLPAVQRFLDVPPANPFYAFIEQMAVRQITLGCGGSNYCPTQPVTREQMAAFIIRALHPPGYVPPTPALQRFADVPSSSPFYGHIEEMAVRAITLGCGGGNYCPTANVTRDQMAAFLVRAFGL